VGRSRSITHDEGPAASPERIAALFKTERWPEAVRELDRITRQTPNDGCSWYDLGVALHRDGNVARAIRVYAKAATFPKLRRFALYKLAGGYAAAGHEAEALSALRGAVRAGFDDWAMMRSDRDLDGLRGRAEFDRLLRRIDPRNVEVEVFDIATNHPGILRLIQNDPEHALQAARAFMNDDDDIEHTSVTARMD
jgi:tetratricopeptide (TPR) repeat protein